MQLPSSRSEGEYVAVAGEQLKYGTFYAVVTCLKWFTLTVMLQSAAIADCAGGGHSHLGSRDAPRGSRKSPRIYTEKNVSQYNRVWTNLIRNELNKSKIRTIIEKKSKGHPVNIYINIHNCIIIVWVKCALVGFKILNIFDRQRKKCTRIIKFCKVCFSCWH